MTVENCATTYRGVPVPWVVEWTGEVRNDPIQSRPVSGGVEVRYPDERPSDRVLGVLWLRTETDRTGDPQFAKLNVVRQRDAILFELCQVCGQPARGSWLIPPSEKVKSGPIRTATPPTCEVCVPIARRLCPQLQASQGVLLQVRHYRPWGVWGDIVELRGSRMSHGQTEVPLLDQRSQRNMLGRQLVAEIFDYRKARV